jgi:hypothetical protein
MEIIYRILSGATITGVILFGLATAYSLVTGRYWGSIIAVIGTWAFILATKHIRKLSKTFVIGNSAIGVIVALCLVVYLLPYRPTAAKLNLTPETATAEMIFGIIYILPCIAGGLLGSYIPILRYSGKR